MVSHERKQEDFQWEKPRKASLGLGWVRGQEVGDSSCVLYLTPEDRCTLLLTPCRSHHQEERESRTDGEKPVRQPVDAQQTPPYHLSTHPHHGLETAHTQGYRIRGQGEWQLQCQPVTRHRWALHSSSLITAGFPRLPEKGNLWSLSSLLPSLSREGHFQMTPISLSVLGPTVQPSPYARPPWVLQDLTVTSFAGVLGLPPMLLLRF